MIAYPGNHLLNDIVWMLLDLSDEGVQVMMRRQDHRIGFYFVEFEVVRSFALDVLDLGVDFLGELGVDEGNGQVLVEFRFEPSYNVFPLALILDVVQDLEIHRPAIARGIQLGVLHQLLF